VAVTIGTDDNLDIWIWDLVRETMTRLTFAEGEDASPLWTPDSKRIIYTSLRESKDVRDIFWKAADGTGQVEKLASAADKNLFPWSLSSDGKTLAVGEASQELSKWDIAVLSMEGDRNIKPLLQEEYNEFQPTISPDGKYMAYMSDESGEARIYVRPFPEVNEGKWQISTGYAESPLWSPDGRELFYIGNEGAIEVPLDTKSTFNAGKPRLLFQGLYVSGYGESPPWDISPNGKRFLMIKLPQATGEASTERIPRKINIVLNWLEELKERVPVP
jgi:Tol biopolymer transport system component